MIITLLENIARRLVYTFPEVFWRVWGKGDEWKELLTTPLSSEDLRPRQEPNANCEVFQNILPVKRNRGNHMWNARTREVVFLSALFDFRCAPKVVNSDVEGSFVPQNIDWLGLFNSVQAQIFFTTVTNSNSGSGSSLSTVAPEAESPPLSQALPNTSSNFTTSSSSFMGEANFHFGQSSASSSSSSSAPPINNDKEIESILSLWIESEQGRETASKATPKRTSVEEELDRYIRYVATSLVFNGSQDPLELWSDGIFGKKFPRLRGVAMTVLSVPGSQAISERIFSVAKLFSSNNRGSMSHDTVEALATVNFAAKNYQSAPPPRDVEIPTGVSLGFPRYTQPQNFKRKREDIPEE